MIRRRIRGQRPLESRHPHFPLRDPNSRADYLLRAWPDPRCFRRGWSQPEWVEMDPPLLAWASEHQPDPGWFDPLGPGPRRSSGVQPALLEEPPRLLRGALDGFWEAVPPEVEEPLRPLPTGTWPLLRLASLDASMVDLLRSNLALAVALAHLDHFVGEKVWNRRERQLALAHGRQHDALAALGFPGRRGVRRVLARIEPRALTVDALLQLQRAYRRTGGDLPLSHVPRLNAGVLALVCDAATAPHARPSLLREVAGRDDEEDQPRAVFLLRDSLWMLDELGRPRADFRPRDLGQLEQFHDTLARELRHQRWELRRRAAERRREQDRARDEEPNARGDTPVAPPAAPAPRRPRRFPDPPVPDATGHHGLRTRALRTPRELRAWARAQRHCAAIYEDRCFSGTDYIYAVLAPEPATIGLAWTPTRGWRLEQLAGRQNRPVMTPTADAIRAWLADHGAGMVPIRTL